MKIRRALETFSNAITQFAFLIKRAHTHTFNGNFSKEIPSEQSSMVGQRYSIKLVLCSEDNNEPAGFYALRIPSVGLFVAHKTRLTSHQSFSIRSLAFARHFKIRSNAIVVIIPHRYHCHN